MVPLVQCHVNEAICNGHPPHMTQILLWRSFEHKCKTHMQTAKHNNPVFVFLPNSHIAIYTVHFILISPCKLAIKVYIGNSEQQFRKVPATRTNTLQSCAQKRALPHLNHGETPPPMMFTALVQ